MFTFGHVGWMRRFSASRGKRRTRRLQPRVGKVADYLSQIDETMPSSDRGPQAPDLEPSRG